MSECLFSLHKYCLIMKRLDYNPPIKYGTTEFVRVFCGMCVKVTYAKAKKARKFVVVNTL